MNIVFFQHGNYAEAYNRFQHEGNETYRDQKASVDFVSRLSNNNSVTTVAITENSHDINLTPTLRSIGISYIDLTKERIPLFFDTLKPDRLICRTPNWQVLRQARINSIPTLAHFADIFHNSSPRAFFQNMRLRATLTGKNVTCITNHSRNASLSLRNALFFPKSRIVPWDRRTIDSHLDPRDFSGAENAPSLFYAGSLSESKGVGDLLYAISILNTRGIDATLSVASGSNPNEWINLAEKLRISDRISFKGLIANDQILREMRAHDLVIVPSRQNYAEGLPNTLRESLAVKTPLVISDHPAFKGRIEKDKECLMFRAGDATSLANAIQRLTATPSLYRHLSQNSQAALERLPFGIFWDQLWELFLRNPEPHASWIQENSLESLMN